VHDGAVARDVDDWVMYLGGAGGGPARHGKSGNLTRDPGLQPTVKLSPIRPNALG